MERALLSGLIAALAMCACARSDVKSGGTRQKDEPTDNEVRVVEQETRILDDATRLGEPIVHANLMLIPVLSRKPIEEDVDYLTLDEAFAEKLIEIRETGNVSQLELHNKSDRPIFLMAGEIIIGGRQDRVIAKDTLLPAREVAKLDVRCVEQGRWAAAAGEDPSVFRSAGALAHSDLRQAANYEEQGDVWKEVAHKNALRKKSNETQTYRQVATEKDIDKAIEPYQKHFESELAKVEGRDRMVGLVVKMNGELTGVESFGSPKLFGKLEGKILRSYYVQSIDLPPPADPTSLTKVPTPADVKLFQAETEAAEAKAVADTPAAATEQAESDDAVGSRVMEKKAGGKTKEVYKSIVKRRKK